MKIILEISRIIIIFLFLGMLLGSIVSNIYTSLNIESEKYGWMAAFAIYILIYVFYKNKLQFSGWYRTKNSKKISKFPFIILCFLSALLFLMPIFLSK